MRNLDGLRGWRLDNGHYLDPYKPASFHLCMLLCCYEPSFGNSSFCPQHQEEMEKLRTSSEGK